MKTVTYDEARDSERRTMANAAPVPRSSNVATIKACVREVERAEEKLRRALDRCRHPLKQRMLQHWVDTDTYGRMIGGGTIVRCNLCCKTLSSTERRR